MFRVLLTGALLVVAAIASSGVGGVSAGGGCHSTELTDGSGVAVDLTKNCFEPNVLRVDAGQTVTWTNRDPDPHTVTGVAESFGDYTELSEGGAVTHEFHDPGVFPYFCVIHPSMVGAIVVGDGVSAAADTGVSAAPTDSNGDIGLSTASVAAIAGVGIGVAALGLVGFRTLSRRPSPGS
jgi:plastocyanin